jgi:hypothetical protein
LKGLRIRDVVDSPYIPQIQPICIEFGLHVIVLYSLSKVPQSGYPSWSRLGVLHTHKATLVAAVQRQNQPLVEHGSEEASFANGLGTGPPVLEKDPASWEYSSNLTKSHASRGDGLRYL